MKVSEDIAVSKINGLFQMNYTASPSVSTHHLGDIIITIHFKCTVYYLLKEFALHILYKSS